MNVNDIKTPAYVCELSKLQANLKVLSDVGERSGAHVLCALKGFAFSLAMPYVARFLSGTTCSGLWEAKYANEFFRANLDDKFQNPARENLNLNLDENLSNSKTNSVQISNKKFASNLDKNSSQNIRNLGAQVGKKFAQEQISSQNNVNFSSILDTKPHKNGEIHVYSPAYKDDEIDEILSIANHVVFNSANQWQKYRAKALRAGVCCGLRVNPQTSFSPVEAYNPCGKFSRLGMRADALKKALCDDPEFLYGISGLHFHALCEESAEALERVVAVFERDFGEYFAGLKWVNFGGGHHITKHGYDVERLVRLVQNFREKWGLEVYLEPGEAVGWECGYLASSVIDIVENEAKIAILDVSAEAHMPDTILMPYRPVVRGEIRVNLDEKTGNFNENLALHSELNLHASAKTLTRENSCLNLGANLDATSSNLNANSELNLDEIQTKFDENLVQNLDTDDLNKTRENLKRNSDEISLNLDTNLVKFDDESGAKNRPIYEYRLGAHTCLAGDIVGLAAGEPIYRFKKPLSVGDRVIFEDQIHYTIVKNTTFNGVKLPSLVLVDERGEVLAMREFDWCEYRDRN
jgi:carboxynorspermidine decarboxylase